MDDEGTFNVRYANPEVFHDLKYREDELEATNEQLLELLRPFAIEFALREKAPQWLIESLDVAKHIDKIVSDLRHIKGGQEYVLSILQTLKPDLKWYRGGTFKKFGEDVYGENAQFFTAEELATPIVDGHGNGAFNRPDLAKGFLQITPRATPVLYTLTIGALLEGIANKAIALISQSNYDLCLKRGEDTKQFLQFCRKHLKIQYIDPTTLSNPAE